MKKAYGADKAEIHYTVEVVTDTLGRGLNSHTNSFFYILVSGQLQVRTPFSRPELEGVRLRDLPLYCLKEFTYKQIRKLLSYNWLKSRRWLRFYILNKPICLPSIVLMSKSYHELDLNIRHSFSRTFLILANFFYRYVFDSHFLLANKAP